MERGTAHLGALLGTPTFYALRSTSLMFNPTIDRRSALRRLSAVLGGVATAPLAAGLLGGCRTPGGADLAAYEYQTLTGGQPDLLAALVDQIIPPTDTPGAADVGVPQFIDTMLTDWYAPDERDGFLAGLDAIDGQADGGSFVAPTRGRRS